MLTRHTFPSLLLALLFAQQSVASDVEAFDYEVVNTYPHDRNAFTQGLFFKDGHLFESTGHYGSSSIRKISLTTGRILEQYDFNDRYFGEGIVAWDDNVIAVTWRSQKGFVFGIDDFERKRVFHYQGEGWGLTQDGSHIIMSDGTDRLRFLNPETFAREKSVSVTLRGDKVRNLNELEWIDGEVFANVWQSDWVLRIEPETGRVTGMIDLSGLLPEADRRPGHTDVLNGIAYDAETQRLFVTGKNWPSIFEILLVSR